MDIHYVCIFAILATATFSSPVTPESECLPCSQSKCPPLPSDCRDGTLLDRCGCCKICISEAIKICATADLHNSNDTWCKQIHSLRKLHLLGAPKKNPLLFNETNINKSENSIQNFTNKSSTKNTYGKNNIMNNEKTYERSKRYLPQQPFVNWGEKIGAVLGGAFGEALVSLTNKAVDTPMKAKLDGNINFQNLPRRRSEMDRLRYKNVDISTRIFDELMTDVASGIGSSIAGALGNIFSSVVSSVLQVPMKGNVQGHVEVENRPNNTVVGDKYRQKRSLSEANHMNQMPQQISLRLLGNEGPFGYKREIQHGSSSDWGVQLGRMLGGIITGIFNTVIGNTYTPSMNTAPFLDINNRNLQSQQYRTFWPSSDTFYQVLGYIANCTSGILRGILGCIMESIFPVPTKENAAENIPIENEQEPEVEEFNQKHSVALGEKIGRTMCGVTRGVIRSIIDYLATGIISLFPLENSKPQQSYRTYINKNPFSAYRDRRSLDDNMNDNFKITYSANNANERSKRSAQEWMSVDWGVEIGKVLGGIITGVFSTLFGSIGVPNTAGASAFEGNTLRSEPVSGFIGNTIGSGISTVFSRMISSIMQIPMKGNAEGKIYAENRPQSTYRSDSMSRFIGDTIGSGIASVVSGMIGSIMQIPMKGNAQGKIYAENQPQSTYRSASVSGFIGNTIGSSIASAVGGMISSIMQIPMKGKAQGKIYAENRPQSTYRSDMTDGFFNTLRRKRSVRIIDDSNNKEFSNTMKDPKQLLSLHEKPIQDDMNFTTSNIPKETLLSLVEKKKAIQVFIDIFNSGIRNLYTDLVATNLVKRATKGDLAPYVQQLSDALLVNNAELLSYITNIILMHINNMSTHLKSQSSVRAELLENHRQLSEDGIKAFKAAMIALNALKTPNTLHDIEELLNTVQSDTQLLLKKLLKTEIFQVVLTKELAYFISEVSIPFIKFIGDIFKELVHVFMESIINNLRNETHSQNIILPHVNTSVVDAILERIIILTDSSVTETVYHITKILLQQEINYVAELIRDDEFLGSVINMKYLSLVPTLAHTFGAAIVEKFAHILKIISLSLNELASHMKNNGLALNHTSEIIPQIQNMHKGAILVQHFLDDLGKGIENILMGILQADFISNNIDLDVNNYLLKKAHSIRGKVAKMLGFLIEILLKLLDHKITGSKQHILENLSDYLSADFIITFEAALNSLDGKLSNQNNQQLQNAANTLGLLGGKALQKLTSSSLARTLLNARFVEFLSSALHAYEKTINKFIGHTVLKGANKLKHKYLMRSDISDIKSKHMDMINDLVRKFTSQKHTQNLKNILKLTMLKIGELISSLLKTELVNHIVNNKTAAELSQFALQSSHSLGELLSDAAEAALDGVHSLAGGERHTKIHRIKRSSESVMQTMTEIAYHGFNVILTAINYLTSPKIVEFINNLIIILVKAVSKIIADIMNTQFAQQYINQNVRYVVMKFVKFLDESGGQMVGAATAAVLNYVHKITTSSISSQTKIPWDKLGVAAKRGLVFIGEFASSISTPENTRIIKDFIHILSAGLADITHEVLKSHLVRRMVGTDLAISLSTLLRDIVAKTGSVGAWLLEKNMHLLHYILAQFGFGGGISERRKMGNALPKTNNLMQSLVYIIKKITSPEVVQDIMELINILSVKGAQLAVNLIKSELGIKLLNRDLANAAASFAKAIGHSGGRLVSILVQRILNFIRTITLRRFSEVSARISFGNVSKGLHKVSLYLIDFLLKILNDRNIAYLKSFTQIIFQGISTSIGSIINSNIGHKFLRHDFAIALENILVSLGKYGGNIAATVLGKLLKIFVFAMEKLRYYLSKEIGSRMMFGDIFITIKSGIISLTRPKIVNDLEDMILMIGREGGSLLSNIFISPFVRNLLNKQLAEGLARAAPTISKISAQIIAFIVKGLMNLIHSIFTGQGISSRRYSLMQERIFSSYPNIKGIFGVIFKIIKGLSSPDNTRAIKNFVVLIGKGLGNLLKEILQSDLAHKMFNPAFAHHLANVVVYVGNKGGQFLGYLIELSLATVYEVFGNESNISGRTFTTFAEKLMQIAQNVLRRLTNPYATNLLKHLIQNTFRNLGFIIVKVLRSDFAQNILNPQLATQAADFILKASRTGGEFLGETAKDLLSIIYRLLPKANYGDRRIKRGIQESSSWQMLSATAMKGLRFLQKSVEYLTKAEVVRSLKEIIANTGNELGILIARVAQSKYALLIFNKQLSQAIAEFAKAVGNLGGKLLGETTATALNHINYLISSSTRKRITSRSGISWYKISSAGLQALEFIGKVLSYVSSPEMTKLMKDFIQILSAESADLVHDIFKSKLAKRIIGMNLAITLSKVFKEVINQLGDIGTLLLEKIMDLIHSLLAKFGVSNIKLNDILPPHLLQSLAQIAQKMTRPDVVNDVVELVKLIIRRVTQILVRLIQSNLAAKFLNRRLIYLLAETAKVLGTSGGKLASVYVKRVLNFINSVSSNGGMSLRSMNDLSTRINLSGIAASIKKVFLFLLALIQNLLSNKNIANVKSMLQIGIERGMMFIGSLIDSRVMHSFLNPSFAKKLKNIIINVGKHVAQIIAETVAKLLQLLVYAARNIKASLSNVHSVKTLPWQKGNIQRSVFQHIRPQRRSSTGNYLLTSGLNLVDHFRKKVSADFANVFLHLHDLFAQAS